MDTDSCFPLWEKLSHLWGVIGKMKSAKSLNPYVGMAQFLQIISKGDNTERKHKVGVNVW